jgi:hypothetical protein
MTAVIVNGTTVGTGAGTYVVPAGGTISMTYTVAPAWAWSQAGSGPGALAQTTLVSATAPAGGQAGTIPQSRFIRGTRQVASRNPPRHVHRADQANRALSAHVDGAIGVP